MWNKNKILRLFAAILFVIFVIFLIVHLLNLPVNRFVSPLVGNKLKNFLLPSPTVHDEDFVQNTSLQTEKTLLSGIELKWEKIDMNLISFEEILGYFEWANRSSCRLLNYFGGSMSHRQVNNEVSHGEDASGKVAPAVAFDGHYAVCLDPIPIAPTPYKCLAYSFGSKDEWSFDMDMADYSCHVFTFDPVTPSEDMEKSDKIHFYSMALNHEDSNNKSLTLDSIYKKLLNRHGNVLIDYLKIDVEGGEFKIIPQLIQSGILDKVKQLTIETHLERDKPLEYYRRMAGIINSLEKTAGMVRFDSYYNHWARAFFPAVKKSGYFAFITAWYNPKFLAL